MERKQNKNTLSIDEPPKLGRFKSVFTPKQVGRFAKNPSDRRSSAMSTQSLEQRVEILEHRCAFLMQVIVEELGFVPPEYDDEVD